ncbi:DUF2705 family protein [Terrilactibacillus laevilacticus]|uniref:DUF2705 family protein n=1 Tax=Terrilactibacillus laevilacticus TaxID=1380157 RepID=A0ABW5PMP1_9BACI|nr:DUF2705 family protein [Terrilactibacillus laevilacticus]
MKREYYIAVLIVIFIQLFCYYQWDSASIDTTGLVILGGLEGHYKYLLLATWYLFFASISFSFIGYMRSYLVGHGIYVLIREKRKIKIPLKRFCHIFFFITLYCFIQVMVSIIFGYFSDMNQKSVHINLTMFITSFLLYIMTLFVLICFQITLELWLSEPVALLVTNIYILGSIIFGGIILQEGKGYSLLYLLISNFSMIKRTDIWHNHAN